ncbi:MAG: DUF655 domain-containing protein [Nanoarchaeota archaeon]|nr:DUF655 domain-containing protein [Nanoarchaeota archaeon]
MEHGKEEYAVVLDFLPHGYPFDDRPSHKKTPIVQAMGKERFVLLELVPRKEMALQPQEDIYIGEGKRDKIHHIIGKLPYDKLTQTARQELEYVIKEQVHKNQERYVEFFNLAQPLTTRMHQIELLPGVGKKHMWEILEARKDKDFEDFADIRKRVKLLPNPEKLIIRRIISEVEGKEKHKLFAD